MKNETKTCPICKSSLQYLGIETVNGKSCQIWICQNASCVLARLKIKIFREVESNE